MTKFYTAKQAFDHMGCDLPHPRRIWSRRTRDRSAAVLMLWADHFFIDRDTLAIRYSNFDTFTKTTNVTWQTTHMNRDRIADLKWARDNYNGLFKIVVATPYDFNEEPRRIRHVHSRPDMLMQLVSLKEDTGEFSAVVVQQTWAQAA